MKKQLAISLLEPIHTMFISNLSTKKNKKNEIKKSHFHFGPIIMLCLPHALRKDKHLPMASFRLACSAMGAHGRSHEIDIFPFRFRFLVRLTSKR